MPNQKDHGSIPQGILEQARARPVDPGKLQMLGKQAAALYSEHGTPLTDAVVAVIGKEDLGPEHTRRICEFANTEAFQNEWEKGGSVRNVEFEGGPADPARVLRDMHDGARQGAIRISDYDDPPVKVASENRIEEEIFGKCASVTREEIPPKTNELHRLHQTMSGARDHLGSKLSGTEVTKTAVARELGDAVCDAVLSGESLYKIAAAWSHFSDSKQSFQEAMDVSVTRLKERGVDTDAEKVAHPEPVGMMPNPEHPVISRFIEFSKVARAERVIRSAQERVIENMRPVSQALSESIR